MPEHDNFFAVDFERVPCRWGAECVKKKGYILHADCDVFVDQRENGLGASGKIEFWVEDQSAVWELNDLGVVGMVDGSDDVAIPGDFLGYSGVEKSRITQAGGKKNQREARFPGGDRSVGLAEGMETFKGSVWYAILGDVRVVDGSCSVWHVPCGECIGAGRRLLAMV